MTIATESPDTHEATITDVTIFPTMARMTRTVPVLLEAEQNQTFLIHIPEKLRSDSLRAYARQSGVSIIAVDIIQRKVAVDEADPEIVSLQAQLEDVRTQTTSLETARKRLNKRAQRLDQFSESASTKFGEFMMNGASNPDQIGTLLDYFDSAQTEIDDHLHDLASQLQVLETRQKTLQATLKETTYRPSERLLQVAVTCTVPGNYELDITYDVSAKWTAHYDIALDDDQMEIHYYARISQRSGVDWPLLPLKLSTQSPKSAAHLPTFKPWYINEDDPEEARKRVAHKLDKWTKEQSGIFESGHSVTMKIPMREFEAQAREEILAANQQQTEGSIPGFIQQLNAPLEVKDNGQVYQATLAVLRFPVELSYVSAPQQSENVIWRAKSRNMSSFTLREGRAYLYRDGKYLTDFNFEDAIVPQQPFAVPLASTEQIDIRRRLIERIAAQVESTSRRRIIYRYEIVASNYHDFVAELTIRDQIPVPLHEQVTVELRESDPPIAEVTDMNIIKWVISLAPGETQTLRFMFVLEHPLNMFLTGIV